jgi:ABC-type antimicrobial peptide transport system permease subunit
VDQVVDLVGSGDDPPALLTIIGVAASTATSFYDRPEGGLAYVPLDQSSDLPSAVLIVRTDDNPAALVPVIRQSFALVDPELGLEFVETGRRLASPTTQFFLIVAGITSLLGAFAWVMALAGLFGVLSHLVQLRTREIGIRVALGARHGEIVRMVVRQGLAPVCIGLAAGLTAVLLVAGALGSQFPLLTGAIDPLALLLLAATLTGAAALACYLPARRASWVEPNDALRGPD